MSHKKKCSNPECGVVTEDYMSVNGSPPVCFNCNRKSICYHQIGTVIKHDRECTVTCSDCHAAWLYGLHPSGMTLFDVRGERWY